MAVKNTRGTRNNQHADLTGIKFCDKTWPAPGKAGHPSKGHQCYIPGKHSRCECWCGEPK